MSKFARAAVGLLLFMAPGFGQNFELQKLGSFWHGSFDEGGSEIGAYDPATKRAFVVNGGSKTVDILNIADPTAPAFVSAITFPGGGAANSVSAKNGLIAIAVEAADKQANGTIEFYDANGALLKSFPAGALPDMVAFSPDGRWALSANEGEPNIDYTVDPVGSVTIVDLLNGLENATAVTVDFSAFNGAVLEPGIRIFGPNATVAQDLEPEYIAFSADSTTAYVTLQEANAIGILNIAGGFFTRIAALGFKDHSIPGNGLDASDQNSGNINIATWPVKGMYQPDGIAAFQYGGDTYLVTANEGDVREYDGFAEIRRIGAGATVLDPAVFPDAATLKNNNNLGRLNHTTATGNTDADAEFEQLYVFGARSFSVWNSNIVQMFDSGDQFEQYLAANTPDTFNISNTNNTKKNRSDDKGPEPEEVEVFTLGGRTFATIGLERDGGLMTYDLVTPSNPVFVNYTTNRNFAQTPGLNQGGDLGPEGILFIPAADSPNGKPLLMVTNEISATTTLYQVRALGDVTGKLQIAVSGFTLNRPTNTFWGAVTFTNTTAETIEGPFYFIPANLGADLELLNKTGLWQGAPYLEVPGVATLAPGATASVRVQFNRTADRITFDPKFFVGSL